LINQSTYARACEALFCFPCRLFQKGNETSKSRLAASGYAANTKWRKLANRIPEHEKSNVHKDCYLAWRDLERRLRSSTCVENLLEASFQSETAKRFNLLKIIIDIVLFLGEQGLAFRGSSQMIGDQRNGNFLW